jgi:DNA-binding NarL/FixJ family response regulator
MNIVVIDDEKAMHLVMKRMLATIAGVQSVECFLETATAYSYLEVSPADMVLVDISMPRENGIQFAQRLRESGKEIKLVFVTSHKEYALPAFDVHAYDYIVKPVTQERLNKTVQRVLAERSVAISKAKAASLPQESLTGPMEKNYMEDNDAAGSRKSPLIDPLTNREIEILLALAEGLSNKEIADRFVLTEGTVKNHVFNLYGKLGVQRRGQAIVRARELRILS